jgi:hypothetical protein
MGIGAGMGEHRPVPSRRKVTICAAAAGQRSPARRWIGDTEERAFPHDGARDAVALDAALPGGTSVGVASARRPR